jgi:Na+/H+ antiporter NhaD/arsenite permease-like protein
VVYAFKLHVVSQWNLEECGMFSSQPLSTLSLLSVGLSNLVSNVPAVMLLEPVVRVMAPERQETAWLALAMSSTLAGNLTLLGSVANLIVVENARQVGIAVSF